VSVPADNLACFNLAAAFVLRELLEAFPRSTLLDATELQSRIADLPVDCAWSSMTQHNLTACTIRYLIEEGLVRATDPRGLGGRFPGCVLTARGFTALQRRLNAVDPGPTLAGRLRQFSQALLPEALAEVISRFIAP
jgi:hypothetical protein